VGILAISGHENERERERERERQREREGDHNGRPHTPIHAHRIQVYPREFGSFEKM